MDRKALPAPSSVQAARETTYAPLQTDVEKKIAAIWQKAVHETHADLCDSTDGKYRAEVRSAAALNLFHARRLLRETDQQSDASRIKNFYRDRMFELRDILNKTVDWEGLDDVKATLGDVLEQFGKAHRRDPPRGLDNGPRPNPFRLRRRAP